MNDWPRQPQHTSRTVTDYFQSVYPQRDSWLARLAFRRGEHRRLRDIGRWLPSLLGRSLLDAGCGDGTFLAALLAPARTARPQVIRLEDLIATNVCAATARLRGHAEVVEGDVHDSCTQIQAARHDVVLAIGILDYWPDWSRRLVHLVGRSRGLTIVTLPVPSGLHYRARRVWLARHRIALPRVTRHDLETVLLALGLPFEIRRTRLEWIVLIDSSTRQGMLPSSSASTRPNTKKVTHR